MFFLLLKLTLILFRSENQFILEVIWPRRSKFIPRITSLASANRNSNRRKGYPYCSPIPRMLTRTTVWSGKSKYTESDSVFRTERWANQAKNRIPLPNKATDRKIQNNFEDDQFYRRRQIMSKFIDSQRISRTPDLHLNKRNIQISENNQIQKSASEVLIYCKIFFPVLICLIVPACTPPYPPSGSRGVTCKKKSCM